MSRTWPADYDSECYVLLPVPVAAVPIVAGKIGELEQRSEWASEADWEQGYQFAACLEACLMECGQSFSETMTLLAVALGANEIAEADLSPAFPALAARLAAARAADTAGVLGKQPLNDSPSAILRLSELLQPFVEGGDQPAPAEPTIWRMMRSAWEFGAYWKTDAGVGGATEDTLQEVGALLTILSGMQEQSIADVKAVWPNIGIALEEAQGRELGNSTSLLVKSDAADTGDPSAIIRLSEIARLLSGKFPDSGALWWQKDGQPVTLYDLYEQQGGLSDDNPDGVNWLDYVSDLIGISTDITDLLDSFGPSPGKLKKDGLMIALIAVEFMNLSMTTNLLVNLIGKDKFVQNSAGAPAATHDYLEALLKAQRGLGIQRGETDWAGQSIGAGLAPDGSPPGDSVLQALRGDVAASATRNVIDALGTPLGNMDALLTAIDAKFQILMSDTDDLNLWQLKNIGQLLQFIRDHTGLLPIIASDSSQPGYTNLKDLLDQLGVAGDNSAVVTALNTINDELMWMMAAPYPREDRVDLYDLQRLLQCICSGIQDIVISQPAQSPYASGSKAALSGISAPSDMCQRAGWLTQSLDTIGFELLLEQPITKELVIRKYQEVMQAVVPGEFAQSIALTLNAYKRDIARSNLSGAVAWSNYFQSQQEALKCLIFNAATPFDAKSAWDIAMDQAGARVLPFPTALKQMVWGDLLNDLYKEKLPLDNSVLADFSSDCSACGGGGGGLDPNACVTTSGARCGPVVTIGSYRYALLYPTTHVSWEATKTDRTSNGYYVANCSGVDWADQAFITSPDMQNFRLQIVTPNASNPSYGDLQEQGVTVFWVDDPQSDTGLENAATSNEVTSIESTVGSSTSRFALFMKYPTTLGWIETPEPIVQLCPPLA